MSERYIKVFSGDPNLYTENAPVVIQASALLKDTETGRMIAQLKFQNISGKVISYVKATITQLDAVSNPLGDAMAFEYLDLSVADKEDFGSKKPLPLPNASTRAFRVGVSTVGFADGSVWTSDNTDWKFAEEDSAVSKAVEVESAYKKALALSKSKKAEDVSKAKEIFENIQADKDVTMELSMCANQIKSFEKKKCKMIRLSALLASGAVMFALLGYFVAYPLIAYWSGDYSVYIKMYSVKEFKIPDGVTEISPNAFADFDTLESITIPDSVKHIGEKAFYNCDSLESVTIPEGVTSIGECAFAVCDNLRSIIIPSSVTEIGYGAFNDSPNLENITLPSGITKIEDYTFDWCSSLQSVTIPEGVTSIGERAFSNCSSLESISIPDTVTSISCCVFCNSDKLISIYYSGTKEQWNNIDKDVWAYDKDAGWDYRTSQYTIYCTDGEIPK